MADSKRSSMGGSGKRQQRDEQASQPGAMGGRERVEGTSAEEALEDAKGHFGKTRKQSADTELDASGE